MERFPNREDPYPFLVVYLANNRRILDVSNSKQSFYSFTYGEKSLPYYLFNFFF